MIIRGKKYFAKVLADRQMTQRGLARLMELDVASLNRMLNGQRRALLIEACEMARLLNLDLYTVAHHLGMELQGIRMPPDLKVMTDEKNGTTNK